MPGNSEITVRYDSMAIELDCIERVALSSGLVLKGGPHGLMRSLWKFMERNARQNCNPAAPTACCNRPPAHPGQMSASKDT